MIIRVLKDKSSPFHLRKIERNKRVDSWKLLQKSVFEAHYEMLTTLVELDLNLPST